MLDNNLSSDAFAGKALYLSLVVVCVCVFVSSDVVLLGESLVGPSPRLCTQDSLISIFFSWINFFKLSDIYDAPSFSFT